MGMPPINSATAGATSPATSVPPAGGPTDQTTVPTDPKKSGPAQQQPPTQGGGPTGSATAGASFVQQGRGKKHNHGYYVRQVAGQGGDVVQQVAQSDLGKPHQGGPVYGGGAATATATAGATATTSTPALGGPEAPAADQNAIVIGLIDSIIAIAKELAATNPAVQPILDQMVALRATFTAGATGGGAAQTPPKDEDPKADPKAPEPKPADSGSSTTPPATTPPADTSSGSTTTPPADTGSTSGSAPADPGTQPPAAPPAGAGAPGTVA